MTPTSTAKLRTALFPGSFNPFTPGHADIVRRGLELFDSIIIGVGVNCRKPAADIEAILAPIRRLYNAEPRVSVEAYSELTVRFAQRIGAQFLLRGVRSVKDFEYERDLAQVNRQLSGIDSVILFSDPALAAWSSSVVRELQAFGEDIDPYLPH
ncbi:MAG: pantetheine-phosphate adenylyltransferase [Bacteroidales bacterium]|nr:pantetheine-phosphate adenylyltransferase [Bacteroidales bacterium]